MQADTLGEVGILGTVVLRVYSGTLFPIFIEIGSYLTDKEPKISWHSFFETRCIYVIVYFAQCYSAVQVPGNFHVSTHASRAQPQYPDMSHEINAVTFGDSAVHVRRFCLAQSVCYHRLLGHTCAPD